MESKYKVGNTVKIKQFLVSGDYRNGVNNDMRKQVGKTFKIESVYPASNSACEIPDDGFNYKLEGIGWVWTSAMFEDPSEVISLEDSIDNSLDAFITKKTCPELDFTL